MQVMHTFSAWGLFVRYVRKNARLATSRTMLAAASATPPPPPLTLPATFDATLEWSRAVTERTCQLPRRAAGHNRTTSVAAIVTGGRHDVAALSTMRGTARSALQAVHNQRCYAARHGYAYHRITRSFLNQSSCLACEQQKKPGSGGGKPRSRPKPLNGMFNKPFNLKYALDAAPYGAWVLWVDGDVLFMNPNMRVEEALRRARADTAAQPLADSDAEAETSSDGAGAQQPQPPQPAGRCDVVVQSHLNAGVLAVRKSCWSMRFIDWWLAHRDWCAYKPLHDNGPMAMAVRAALRGEISEHRPPPDYVPPPAAMDSDPRGVCGAAFNMSGLSYARSRVCVARGGFGNRTATHTHDGRGFNSPWYPGDLLAHFLGSIYGEVRVCFSSFVKAQASPAAQACTCEPAALPCAATAAHPERNCHPSATWRSWAAVNANYAKGFWAY